MDSVMDDRDKLDALLSDANTPPNVKQTLSDLHSAVSYVDGVDFERDGDGQPYRVVPKQEREPESENGGTLDPDPVDKRDEGQDARPESPTEPQPGEGQDAPSAPNAAPSGSTFGNG